MALAIAVSLKRETHRPSCSVAQRATGAMRDHLAEAKLALAIAVLLKKKTHRPFCSVAQRATGAMRDHLLEA